MSIEKNYFGKTKNNEDVYKYTLTNRNGMQVSIMDLGGTIINIIVPDHDGVMRDVVLGHDSVSDYENFSGYLGALIGRHANRLAEGKMIINGKEYCAGINDGKNSLHGGIVGFDQKIWQAETLDGENVSLVLKLFSPDMEEGFPGNLNVTVDYTLTNDNELQINYSGVCDRDTVLNMTNHTYFNLGGYESGSVADHKILMNCSFYTPNNTECMPTGEILSVEGTPFDFRTAKRLGDGLNSEHEQIKLFNGFDHNFVIDESGYRKCSSVVNEKTGIIMDVFTTKPGIQFYTSNALTDGMKGKNNVLHHPHDGLCLETQFFPNSMKCSHFPSAVLRANDTYNHKTSYKFSVLK